MITPATISPDRLKQMCSVLVLGDGPVPADVLLCGQNPGADEVLMQLDFGLPPIPFVGQAGAELDEYLSQVGLGRGDIYITNAYKCYTEDNRRPEKWELREHQELLMEEIHMVQPKIIGGIGDTACQWLSWIAHQPFRDMSTEHSIPRWIDLDGYKCVLVPLMHPAAGLHAPSTMGTIFYDFQVLAKVVRGEEGPVNAGAFHPVVGEISVDCGLDYALSQYTPHPMLMTIDTEGDKENPWGLTFSVDGKSGWRIGVEMPDSLMLFNQRIHEVAGITIVLQHSLHDIPVLLKLGVDVRDLPIIDTMVLAYLLCVEPQGLKGLGWRWCRYRMTEYGEIADPVTEEMTRGYLKQALGVDWDSCPVCYSSGNLGVKHWVIGNPLHYHLLPPGMDKEPILTPKGNIRKKFLPYMNWCPGGEKVQGGEKVVPLNKKIKAMLGVGETVPTSAELDDDPIPF